MATATTRQSETSWRQAVTAGRRGYRNLRYFLQSVPYMLPRLVQCNICGWRGKHFRSDAWHKHSICPYCRSSIRHRLLFAALEHLEEVSWNRVVRGKRVLHFAPEPRIEWRLRAAARTYFSADCHNRRNLQLDISRMQSLGDETFDLLLACDVLEHVQHDRRAMQEVYRVLSPGGCAVLTVPQQDGLESTYEDASIVDPAQRERVFGQHDHLRIYGQDFSGLLESAGFRVRTVDETDFSEELVRQHVLFPPEISPHPLATNFRKVYWAVRPR